MKIFISYASEDRAIAEQIQLALAADKNKIFFDAQSLAPGGDYNSRIANAIKDCDLLIFLISRNSIRNGSYCLTELSLTRDKWPHPKGKVIPVLLSKIEFEQIPNYLRAVTVCEPQGNIPAEVLSIVVDLKRKHWKQKKKKAIFIGLGSSLVAYLSGLFFLGNRSEQWESMGVSVTGEKISLNSNSIKGSRGNRSFTYKIGNEAIEAVANCNSKQWFAKRYSKWYKPQSKATQDMIAFICN